MDSRRWRRRLFFVCYTCNVYHVWTFVVVMREWKQEKKEDLHWYWQFSSIVRRLHKKFINIVWSISCTWSLNAKTIGSTSSAFVVSYPIICVDFREEINFSRRRNEEPSNRSTFLPFLTTNTFFLSLLHTYIHCTKTLTGFLICGCEREHIFTKYFEWTWVSETIFHACIYSILVLSELV